MPRTGQHPPYLQKRRRRWYAVLEIPAALRQQFGKPRFVRSLETDSLATAKRRVTRIVHEWQSDLERARHGDAAEDDAAFFRRALRKARTEAERSDVLERIGDAADAIGYATVDNIGERPGSSLAARQFYAEATGQRVRVNEHLDEYGKSLGHLKGKTAAMRVATIERLAAKFRTVQDVTRPEVRRWVTDLTAELNPATVQRMLSDCRGYWRYLGTIGVVPEDDATPFDRLGLKAKSVSWQQFEPAEVVRLLAEAERRKDGQLADLIRLAMYSGARREELCALQVDKVAADRFTIAEAKTTAGVRVVPIHAKLRETMARLVAASDDGFVLSGLAENKHGDRGDGLGKRFTRLKKALGFGELHVFHSIRGTVITMLERAGVPEGTVQDLVGHERSTITGSTYSGKSTFEMRRDAVAKLAYPAS